MGLYSTRQANNSLQAVYEDRTVALRKLETVQRLVSRNQYLMATALLAPTTADATKLLEEVPSNLDQVTKVYGQYMATSLTAAEETAAKSWLEKRATYRDTGLIPTMTAGVSDIQHKPKTPAYAPVATPVRKPVAAAKPVYST